MYIKQETHQDIEKAKKIINLRFYKNIDDFSKYSSLYAFTNENINDVYNYLDINEKKVLTVAGSGDHIFEAYSKGAKEVKSFDINCLTKYYIELKKAALITLQREEFIEYFFMEPIFSEEPNFFNISTYEKIRRCLDKNTRYFWDTLYATFPGKIIRASKLFYSTEESYNFLISGLSYLQPQNYQNLKRLLQNTQLITPQSFQVTNITDIHKVFIDTFDIIYLSNIADYIDEIFPKPYIDNFQSFIQKHLDPMLNEQGKILAAYMFFANYNNYKYIPLINKPNSRKKFLSKNYIQRIIDNSRFGKFENDRILIYKKQN